MGQTVKQWLEQHSTYVVQSTSQASSYFTIEGFTVRYSDHHATGSKYNLSITRTSKTDYVCVGSPLKLMRCLHTPKDVKLLIESYLFALKCNKCTNISKDTVNKAPKAEKIKKRSKAEKRAITRAEHVEEALSYIKSIPVECFPVDITDYTDTDILEMNRTFNSTCLGKKWSNVVQSFYEKHPEWGFAMCDIVNKMKLMCNDAKSIIWENFKNYVEMYESK